MKLSKKVLAAFSVIAMLAVSMAVVSCAAEEDDDEKNAITGSNNDYAINFTNEDSTMYRAYHATYNNHLGGLCNISLDKNAVGDGSIGYIFDLESNPNRAVKDPRTFCIVGFNLATAGQAKYYVSRYNNITNIQDDNFGASTTAAEGQPKEVEYIQLSDAHKFALADCEDSTTGKYELTVDVNGENKAAGYVVKIYKGKLAKADLAAATPVDTVTIPATALYPTTSTLKQQAAAVYVNVYAKKTMTATWHYADTYSAAETVEE